MQKQKPGSILVLSKAALVLKACHLAGRGLSLGEIARSISLPRSTVQRLVNALVAEGFLLADGRARTIRLGPELLAMGAAATTDMVELSKPELASLSRRTGETVDLARLNRDHMVFVSQVPSAQRLSAISAVGDTFPLHCTANGKAALALLPPAQWRGLLTGKLRAYTERTRTSWLDLEQDLLETANSGIAVDQEEHTRGICAIGMAFTDKARNIYALSIPMPSVRFKQQRLRCEQALRETVASLQNRL
jgi:IclR family transcriptional regulator, acetate operon repressor